MFTLSKTHSGQRQDGRALSRKRIWLRTLVLAGLGAMMVVTGLCLLPGCGSDSTPGGSVKGKDAKTVTSPKTKKMQGAISLLVDKEQTGPGKTRTIKQRPESTFVEPIPGVTQEELEARAAADRKIIESPDTEVFPGMTQRELEARMAADKASFDLKTAEVFPGTGITQVQLEARLVADKSFDPMTAEVLPGMTQAQLEAQNANQRVPDKRELVPPAAGK